MKLPDWLYSRAYLLMLLTTLFWAGNAIAGKIAIGHISPFILTSSRWFLALFILLPFALPYVKNDWEKIKPQLILLFMLGAVGYTCFNNMMYLALNSTSAINATIIQSSMPLFIFLLNLIFFRLKVSKSAIIGFTITLIGVLVITFHGNFALFSRLELNIGDLLMLVAVIAYAIYSVFLNKKPDINWLSILTMLIGAAAVSSIPFVLFEFASGNAILPDLTGLMVIIYTAVFASLCAQAFWIRSIELIGSNATGMFINLVPLFGAILAISILGEEFELFHIIGAGLIIIGISIGKRQSKQSKLIN